MLSRNRRRHVLSRLNPFSRKTRKPAAELARCAGERPEMLEHLEQRQLLFTLTVTAPDPGLDVGTVTAFFGYTIPYLAPTSAPGTSPAEAVLEDFNTDDPGEPPVNIAPNFIFEGSNLQLSYVQGQLSVARLVNVGDPQGNENALEFTMQLGESFRFRVPFGETGKATVPLVGFKNAPGFPGTWLMDIAGNFDTNAVTVELLWAGDVVTSFTGGALFALSTPIAVGRQYAFAAPQDLSFDEIRFVATGGPTGPFRVDNVSFGVPAGNFAQIVTSRIFGAQVVFTGPVGSSVTFLDLYGRDMRQSIVLPALSSGNVQLTVIDRDDDGIPDVGFTNDGIGRIVINGSNRDTALTIWGGTIESFQGAPPANSEFTEPIAPGFADSYAFLLTPSAIGNFDDLEGGGFGYVATPQGQAWNVTGLPPGPGSVIIGSPFVRPLGAYNPGAPAGGAANFSRADQGIFVQGGAPIASVYLHGILHGASTFTGYVDRIITGYNVGSIAVAGDLGFFSSGSDAGLWVDDDGAPFSSTGATLTVGRTLGEFAVAGRNLMNVVVVGDLNSPLARPARDVLRYFEHEYSTGGGTTQTPLANIRAQLAGNAFRANNRFASDLGFFFARQDQSPLFGPGYLRNDAILSAEWIGSIGTAAQIYGQLGRQDAFNGGDDFSDVYAFAADGTQDIVVQLDSTLLGGLIGTYMRIVDQDGRTVAAPQIARDTSEFIGMRYRPTMPGVYYLVVQTPNGQTQDYVINISGLAPATFGAYRTGASSGRNGAAANTIQVLSGSMGSMRVGTAFVDGGGGQVDPGVIINLVPTQVDANDDEPDEYMALRAMSVSVPGNLYNITTGSDIQDNQGTPSTFSLNVGGNLGTVIIGLSPIPGIAPTEGDFRRANFAIGGSIAMFDIRGGLGIDQDSPGVPVDGPNSVVIRTGLNSGSNPSLKGDIGMIRVGSHVGGDTLSLTTPAGSTVGGFLISQDIEFEPGSPNIGIYNSTTPTGLNLNLGFNSDLRFFDLPQIDLSGFPDISIPLLPGQPAVVTDDAGGQVSIQIVGGSAAAGGLIRVMPIGGSLGVAIGRLEVNLDGGAQLLINSLGNFGSTDIITIGRVVITEADVNSTINVTGNTQVDIWQIRQEGGDEFGGISNTTPGGDIVAADMVALTNLFIGTGDLGRTQVPAWGPSLIGPFLGIGGDGAGDVGGAMEVPANTLTGWWNGGLYRPINNSAVGTPPNSWLDDVGSPIDPYLNGLVVRTGNVTSVQVGGAIGDVIANDLTAGNGGILSIIANADVVRTAGRFEGIVGNIYANAIGTVDIGDGLAQKDQAPLATTGIFANDDIVSIVGGRIIGAFISSAIVAANNVATNAAAVGLTDGIGSVNLTGGGDFVDAFVGSVNLDGFWLSFFSQDDGFYGGDINQFIGNTANFLRSEIIATNIRNFSLVGGFYDASTATARTNIDRMEAVGYRNSTLFGGELEFFPNTVTVGNNIGLLTTFGRAGDIDDLTVDALGRILEISARNMSRTQIDADLEVGLIQTVGDLRAVTLTAGLLTQAVIGKNVRSSQISISGPMISMIVTDAVTNTAIDVSGPDGRLELLRVREVYTGSIAVAGPIDRIEVTQGDLIARLVTVTNLRGVAGNINLITAGRDIDLDADIGGTITRIAAGRHLGNRTNPRPIVVHGDVFQIDVANGQMYSDFRIDQRLTGSLIIGAVVNKPGNSLIGSGSLFAFGRIESVVISGDFGGRIISYSGGINSVTINNGSLLKGGAIQAFDGDINAVVINSGHLLGDIHAGFTLFLVQVNASSDGVFGDLGINPALSQGNVYDSLRNQLPPGAVADSTIQGPRITAGFNIGRIELSNGSIFEAFINAGRAIGTISVAGDIRNDTFTTGTGTVIAAGTSIFAVNTTGGISDTIIMAGVRSFGNDGRPGGTGANADTIQSGRIETITGAGNGTNVVVTVGMIAGQDGVYNTGDESVVLGISYVRTVTFATATNVSVFADSPTMNVSAGVVRAGTNFVLFDADLSDGTSVPGGELTAGVPFAFNLPGGIAGTITFTGSGRVFFDAAARKVILVSTSLSTTLLVQANGTLTDFDIVTNDDASVGSITVAAPLAGDSDIVVDAYCLSITTGDFSGTGSIRVGMNVRSITTGAFTGGFISAAYWARDIVIGGAFGTTATTGEARIDAYAASTIVINGTFAALINVDRELGSLTVNGAVTLAQFRAGGSVGAITTGAMSQTRISVGDNLGPVIINGNTTETVIQAGGDLGADVAPGGSGFNADSVSNGNITSVNIVGNFTRSSIVAGLLRGPDIYFGTNDDTSAAGRSNIGSVTISGTQVGSNLGSESFRVSATGAIAVVTLNGQVVSEQGNFKVESLATRSNPFRIQDVVIGQESQTWNATFYFNQAIDASTFGPALSIAEVRDGGLTLIPLVQGVDYTIIPNPFKDRAVIQFSRTVTDRNLVPPGNQAPGLPGPGVFRFILLSSVLRAAVSEARLDADPSTVAVEDFSRDLIVGDAGDKLAPEIITQGGQNFDMYGPVDLSVVLDNNFTPDGQPDPNQTFVVRGVIGDHPDHGITNFRFAADTDIYMITLRAGQILRMGAMQGAADLSLRFLYDAAGNIQFGSTADTYQLPTDPLAILERSQPADYLIKTTGTYYIVVGNFGLLPAGLLPDAVPGQGDTGDYNFTLQVFDDFDSGFAATTDSGNGTPVVNAPAALVFAGPNQVFQNPGDPGYDDLTEVVIGDYTFTLNPGPDGTRGTSDDIVSGDNRSGITSTRIGSSLTSVISSAIGPRGHSGVPGDVTADVDVFLLNNGQTIQPGRTITVKIKLADLGADLGSFSRETGTDFRGDVQFGIFDITGASAIDDGLLLASPTDFKTIAQAPQDISSQGGVAYGYDANGDFYFTFITTGRIGGLATDPAVYAIYLQGVFNTDYTIEVTQSESAPAANIQQNRQNVFLETRGGTIDWLQVGGLVTTLAPFSGAVLGFTGAATTGQSVDDYILTNLVAKLNSVFTANGLDVVFSTDPGAFEFQPFSTVFLSATTDPITIFNTDNFGYSQHSDPYNTDLNDEAAIFLPSFSQLGYTPAQADIDDFVLSLTAAVGRRVGELVGLRMEGNADPVNDPVNIMAANSVFRDVGQPTNYAYGTAAANLSDGFDTIVNTNFFLGQQNAFALLDKFLTP